MRSTCGKQRHKRVSHPFCLKILPDAIILICPSLNPQVQANVDVVAATYYKVVSLHMHTNVMNQNVALMTIVGVFGHYDHNSEKTIL